MDAARAGEDRSGIDQAFGQQAYPLLLGRADGEWYYVTPYWTRILAKDTKRGSDVQAAWAAGRKITVTITTNAVTIQQPSTQVVVQTVLTGAWKTFRQGTGATIITVSIALLTDWTTGAFGGKLPTLNDTRILGFVALAFAIGFLAAVLSFIQDTYCTKTLPAGQTVEAKAQ